jgi:hypothetical protein
VPVRGIAPARGMAPVRGIARATFGSSDRCSCIDATPAMPAARRGSTPLED